MEINQNLIWDYTFTPEQMQADFYLTGGTALSAFYLKHRYPEDLDFFTESPQGVARAEGMVAALVNKLGLRVTMGRRFQTLFECSVRNKQGEKIEMDFALDFLPRMLRPISLETLKTFFLAKAAELSKDF